MNKAVAVSQYNPFGDLKTLKPSDNRVDVSNGSLIAVSYEARAKGVKRNMRGAEAKKACSDLILVQVPTDHGKADLGIYREAGARVVSVLSKALPGAIIERASIDEVYLDITEEANRRVAAIERSVEEFERTIVLAESSPIAGEDKKELKLSKSTLRVGHAGQAEEANKVGGGDDALREPISIGSAADDIGGKEDNVIVPEMRRAWFDRPPILWAAEDKLLLVSCGIVSELRRAVIEQLGFTCSAGIAHNKMLAKIASSMHKPNRQTIVPASISSALISTLPLSRVQGFGGKLGDALAEFNGRKVETFSDLLAVGKDELAAAFSEETTTWMLCAAVGIDTEPVQQRALPISIGCGKSFRQKNMLPPVALTAADGRVLKWFGELASELEERVQMDTMLHSRRPKQLSVGVSIAVAKRGPDNSSSSNSSSSGSNSSNSSADVVKKWQESQGVSLSKVGPIPNGAQAIAKLALSLITKAITDSSRVQGNSWNITYLTLSATSFMEVASESQSISSFFAKQAATQLSPSPSPSSATPASSSCDNDAATSIPDTFPSGEIILQQQKKKGDASAVLETGIRSRHCTTDTIGNNIHDSRDDDICSIAQTNSRSQGSSSSSAATSYSASFSRPSPNTKKPSNSNNKLLSWMMNQESKSSHTKQEPASEPSVAAAASIGMIDSTTSYTYSLPPQKSSASFASLSLSNCDAGSSSLIKDAYAAASIGQPGDTPYLRDDTAGADAEVFKASHDDVHTPRLPDDVDVVVFNSLPRDLQEELLRSFSIQERQQQQEQQSAAAVAALAATIRREQCCADAESKLPSENNNQRTPSSSKPPAKVSFFHRQPSSSSSLLAENNNTDAAIANNLNGRGVQLSSSGGKGASKRPSSETTMTEKLNKKIKMERGIGRFWRPQSS